MTTENLDSLRFKHLYDRLRQKNSRLKKRKDRGEQLTVEQLEFLEKSMILEARRIWDKMKFEQEIKQKELSPIQRALKKQELVDIGYQCKPYPLERGRPSNKQKEFDLVQIGSEILALEKKKPKKKNIWGYDSIV